MATADKIRQVLETELEPQSLEIIDESDKHRGHSGWRASGETHFKVTIISDRFKGMDLLGRHRLVLSVLQVVMSESGLHAISIFAKTPEEA